jgi:hypothetical protein
MCEINTLAKQAASLLKTSNLIPNIDPVASLVPTPTAADSPSNLQRYGIPLAYLLSRTAMGAGLGAGANYLSEQFYPYEAGNEKARQLALKRSILAGALGGLGTGAIGSAALYNQMSNNSK